VVLLSTIAGLVAAALVLQALWRDEPAVPVEPAA
jgi:hypothetical protein